MKYIFVGLAALSVFYSIPVHAASSPVGTFDAAYNTTCQIAGWAKDPDTTKAISVQVWRDAETAVKGGTLVTSFVASVARTDLSYKDKNHGFVYKFDLKSKLYDGKDHKLFLYGVDATGNANALLKLSPKVIHCTSALTAVNVKDYGAKGDGVADDAPAIQKAVAALAPTGGTVTLPAGVYLLGTSAGGVEVYPNGQSIQNAIILNKPNIVFKGAGVSTVLKLKANAKMRAIAVTANSVTIDSLAIDGNKSQRNGSVSWPGGDVVDTLIGGFHINTVTVKNCEVRNGIEDGIGFWQTNDATVQNCYIHDNGTTAAGGAGVSLSGGARGKAINNRLENNSVGVWTAFGAQNVTIQNNKIKNSSKTGITVGGFTADLGAGNNTGFTISGNTITGNGSAGFDAVSVASANNGTITGNTIVNNAYGSLMVSDDGSNPPSSNWTITNNSCSNVDTSGTQKWGMRILGKSTGIVLRSNTCKDNGTSLSDQIIVSTTTSVNSDWQTANTLIFDRTLVQIK